MKRIMFFLLYWGFVIPETEGQEDYAVLKNGDTVMGKTRFRWNGRKAPFVKIKSGDQKMRFQAAALSHYRLRGRSYLVLPCVHTRNSKHLDPMQVITDGKIKLLSIPCCNSRYHYDLYVLLEDGRQLFVTEENYEKQILPHLQQSAGFRSTATPAQIRYSKRVRGYDTRMATLIAIYNSQ